MTLSQHGIMMTGGEVIVEMLTRFGVDMMFGLPGDQTDIYDALFRQDAIRHVLVRHEQAAAHMADSYARTSRRVGVCDASIGPGATNLISGIAEAFLSGIPVLAMASAVRSDWTGRECFQEIDQVAVFEPITKASISVDSTARIPEIMKQAFRTATTGRPGPVFLSFPIDVLKGRHEFTAADLAVDSRFGQWPANRVAPATEDIAAAAEALLGADRPIILAGGGAVASGASDEIRELAELLDIPVATTFMGKGTLAESHPLCLGPFGLIGRPATNDYVLKADLALALGTRFTNVDTAAWRIPTNTTRIIQVDIEPTQIGRHYAVDLALPGDIKTVVGSMVQVLRENNPPPMSQSADVAAVTSTWRQESGVESPVALDNTSSPIHPLQVIRALRNTMSDADTLICDSGFNQVWGGQYFEVREAGRTYIGPRGFGVMGFSVPAGIAHALANPTQRAVVLCGDGGFAMVMQELETARREGAAITVCIMNNSNLQYIKENQRLLFDSRFMSTDFSELDYAAIANAFGCVGIRVEHSGDLEDAFTEALASDLPAVVDVRILSDAVPDRMSLQKLN